MRRMIRWSLVVLAVGAALLALGFVVGVAATEARHPVSERVLTLLLGFRDSAGQVLRSDAPAGRFGASPPEKSGVEEDFQRLRELGYVVGSEPAREQSGVTVRAPDRVAPGLNLYTSGHASAALLMDREGAVLHEWSVPFEESFPAFEPAAGSTATQYWRRARVFEDGSLLAIHEGVGILKVDANSRLEWAVANGAHHDLDVDEQGRIWVLTRKAHVVPAIHAERPILEDYVTLLSADGEELERWSVLDALRTSHFQSLVDLAEDHGDILHTNTLTLLDGRLADHIPAFAAGNVLLSLPKINTIGVVALPENRLVWAWTGMSDFQHDPTLTPEGNLLLFDNRGYGGHSKVIELEPRTQEVLWAYYGEEGRQFSSECCGTAQRLPNGNTLVTESDSGRAFEVTRDGGIVWEFSSPHRAGESGEWVATLFELIRLPADLPTDWARAAR